VWVCAPKPFKDTTKVKITLLGLWLNQGGSYTLRGITVRNCVGMSEGGGAVLENGLMFIQDTRWENNSAQFGGAIALRLGGRLQMNGTNQFIHNSASKLGGALYANNSFIFLANTTTNFSSNSIAGDESAASANIFAEVTAAVLYPNGGTVPPLIDAANQRLYPVAFVDSKSTCGSSCTGSIAAPYKSIIDAVKNASSPTISGGQIYIQPGVYTDNCNITLSSFSYEFSPWPMPSSGGSVIIDCQHRCFGFSVYAAQFQFSSMTIQNCVTESNGGAITGLQAELILQNMNFDSNSGGMGGAVAVSAGSLSVNGGSFLNNVATSGGGAVSLSNAQAFFYNSTVFNGNLISSIGQTNDMNCQSTSFLDTDGSVNIGEAGCLLSASSPNAVALFPGALDGLLFPKNPTTGVPANVFAGLEFISLVEIDGQTGLPIESTLITKDDVAPTASVFNDSTTFVVQYDVVGPEVQFFSLIHTFFKEDATFTPFGSLEPITVQEGFLKLTVEIGFWPFRSPANSLALSLFVNADGPVTSVSSSPSANGTTYIIKTSEITVTFGTLSYAFYDSTSSVQFVNVTASTQPTGVLYQHLFSSFDLWVGYDPQFGVVLNGDGSDGSSDSTPLIVGLTVGLGGGILLLSAVILVAIVVTSTVVAKLKFKKHRKMVNY